MHIVAPSQGSEAANSGGSSFTMDAESITLTVGQSSLTLKQDGTVELNGKTIAIAGSQHIGLDSERIDLN
jgi:type VI secretion system secreted protein VgrG